MRMTFGAAILALVLSAFGVASADTQTAPAQDPPQDPILRIETGQHTAAITHIAVNAGQKLVATASLDKSVRLWDLESGRLLRTLRVPIGAGPEGSLYSVSIAPDGLSLLATGFTRDSTGSYSIYLIDIPSGQIKRRLAHLPHLANDVAYSANGSAFAAVFGDGGGLAVWDAATGKLLGEDKDYGDLATAVDFGGDGKVATAAFDGFVRLYGGDYKLLTKKKMRAGQKLNAVAFSPDGKFLAVGYQDTLAVDVLNAADLSPAFSADVGGIDGGNLAAVGWLPTSAGYELGAGGTARDKAGKVMVRIWSNQGRGPHADIAVAQDSLSDIAGTPSGMLFAAADPIWGRIDPTHRVTFQSARAIADFRDISGRQFALSKTGETIQFSVGGDGAKSFIFNMATSELTDGAAARADLAPPAQQAASLKVTDWKNSIHPAINGHALPLDQQELSRSAAVAPDGHHVVLGTDNYLRLYDETGKLGKITPLPAPAWGVMISGDGRWTVAALGDGTVRWYALDASQALIERAALFISPDTRKWIAWTPEGYFAHAENGGAELAGYHINKSARETPDWVEFSQLYQLFYSPEIVRKSLAVAAAGGTVAAPNAVSTAVAIVKSQTSPKADIAGYCLAGAAGTPDCRPIAAGITRGFARVPAADQSQPATQSAEPPSFEAQLPAGSGSVTLQYRVAPRQGGIGDVDFFVNGRVLSSSRGFARVSGNGPAPAAVPPDVKERKIDLSPGHNVIFIRAYDAANAVEARSPSVDFVVPPAEARGTGAGPLKKPSMYVLGVGVNKYPPPNTLNFPVKDMTGVVDALQTKLSDTYAGVFAVTLRDEEVTQAAVSRALDDLAAKAAPEDTVIIYLSGHGLVDESVSTKPYYFITQNVDANDIPGTALSQSTLKEKLTAIKSKNVLLFLDTCYSGAMELSTFDRIHNYFGQVYLLAAASSDQQALDNYKGINGPFAYAVIEGLTGKAARGTTVDEHDLGMYVKGELPRLVDDVHPGHKQSASFKTAGGEIQDFPLTRVTP
jgi:WD40 repeat protein